ncbi:hypothetical protein ABT160_43160 [Streptomyces sp. NPDC001941]|uniref:hypothetical protein n=1 Tax=Streptomyces sp. NPDC001941 TaxID=3154659 RepID=UPI0033181146
MELAGAVLSVVAVLAPAIKGWLDSVAYRNRLLARAEVIRARRGDAGRGEAGRG